jgi:ribonucleoside-diphosphate reductase alpha chain
MGQLDIFVNKHLRAALQREGCFTKEVMDAVLERGTLQGIEGIPDNIKRVFVTALDITADDHIAMQTALQQYCCNAISKTVNFPNDATVEDIRDGFIAAWHGKCKGVTVYRNGSREVQVLATTCKDGSCDR